MTPREVARVHFPNLAPTLLADHSVAALAPAGGEPEWAAGVAWETARAVARTGRRVLLVDLSLERPALHAEAKEAGAEGIGDAFAFGVALNHVAREQEPNLFFIGTGSPAADQRAVLTSERWQRLARGFASEGALLLLHVPAAALPVLRIDLGTLIVAAPMGYVPGSDTFPGLAERLLRGTSLLAIVRDTVPPPPRTSGSQRVSVAAATAARRRQRRQIPRAVVGLMIVAAVLGVVALLVSRRGGGTPAAPPEAPSDSAVPPAASGRPRTLSVGAGAAPADSLFYSIQIAAFDNSAKAVEYLGGLGEDGATGTVTPVLLGQQGVWHRVVIGAAPHALAADSMLRDLWRRGRVRRPNGTILRTPLALEIARVSSPVEAEDSVAGLRRRGIPAYIVAADGPVRILVGAFEDDDQVRLADALLRAAGIPSVLVHRAGPRS